MEETVEQALSSFATSGVASLGPILDSSECVRLLHKIRSRSEISPKLFMTERDYQDNRNRGGTNPSFGHNLLEELDTSFVEQDSRVVSTLNEILGEGYELLNKKVVAAIPEEWIPDWVFRELSGLPVPNLGVFVKPQYRNITYFFGIPYHQDIIDYKDRDEDFITMYVYLDDVSEADSPLYLLPGSHSFRTTTFPHDLQHETTELGLECWTYSNRMGALMDVQHVSLTGSRGSVYLWHACILHGTLPSQLNPITTNRISLRYIFAKSNASEASLIGQVNERVREALRTSNQTSSR